MTQTKVDEKTLPIAAAPVEAGFTTALSLTENEQLEVELLEAKPSLVRALKRTVGAKLTEEQFLLYCAWCAAKHVDPVGDAYAFPNREGGIAMGLKIDGMRALARRKAKYSREVELLLNEEGNVYGAKCTIHREGDPAPFVSEVLLKEYRKGGNWDVMPEVMIKKVSEATCLRAAFPDALGGFYEPAEMDNAPS